MGFYTEIYKDSLVACIGKTQSTQFFMD